MVIKIEIGNGGEALDEDTLILLAQKGEKEAFQSLISFYYPYVSKFLRKLCGNETLSEDLTQDTFVKLIRGIDKFNINGNATFSTYVITIAKNCYIDYIRKKRQITVSLEEQEIASSENPLNTVTDVVQMEEVLQALECLPPEQALAIKLKYLEQRTLQEIALRFHCEPKTIKSRIHNGIVKLRKALEGGTVDG